MSEFQKLQEKAISQLKRDIAIFEKYGIKSDLIMRLEKMGCKL